MSVDEKKRMVEGIAKEVKKMAQNETTKGTVKNGRKSADGSAYNANHNTLEATRQQQSHIDQERLELNRYIQFKSDGSMSVIKGGQGGFDARKHEMKIYKDLYGAGLEAKNERYTKTRHTERCRTVKDLYQDPKTAPLETIFQVGNSKDNLDPQLRTQALTRAWAETVKAMQGKYGEHMRFLDAALHRDEAVDHIHCRVAFIGHDRHGFAVPSQNAALAAMGIERPDPTRPNTKYNNPTISFTDELRETFYAACERQGIQINREVQSYSKRQVEILEYKCDRYREENQALEQQAREAMERAAAAEERQQRAEEKTQAAQEALERVIGDTNTLKAEITALRASQAALEAQNKHSVEYGIKLKARLDEVIQEGKATVAENGKLKAVNEQLRAENEQLHQENGQLQKSAAAARQEVSASKQTVAELEDQVTALEMQMEQLRLVKAQAERETAQAKADRDAAVKAAEDMHQQQRNLYMSYAKGANDAKTYGEVEAKPEKKNLRGQVTQEARPACVLVEKDGFERMRKAAGYHYAVDYTQTQIDKLEKALSENEIIQGLRNQVEQQRQEINHLRADNERHHKKSQRDDWTIEQLEQTLGAYGIPNPTQQQTHSHHHRIR